MSIQNCQGAVRTMWSKVLAYSIWICLQISTFVWQFVGEVQIQTEIRGQETEGQPCLVERDSKNAQGLGNLGPNQGDSTRPVTIENSTSKILWPYKQWDMKPALKACLQNITVTLRSFRSAKGHIYFGSWHLGGGVPMIMVLSRLRLIACVTS